MERKLIGVQWTHLFWQFVLRFGGLSQLARVLGVLLDDSLELGSLVVELFAELHESCLLLFNHLRVAKECAECK